MLVVLNGMQTVNKMWFSRVISATLNSFTIGPYTLDFTDDLRRAYDREGRLVYREVDGNQDDLEFEIGVNEFGAITNVNPRMHLMEKLEANYTAFKTSMRYYSDAYNDPWYDYGLVKEIDAPLPGSNGQWTYLFPFDYDSLIADYRSRRVPIHVIYGIFSKTFIQKVCHDLNDVKIINIIRNPSVSFLLNKKVWELDPGAGQTPRIPEDQDINIFEQSIITSALLSKMPGVTTVRYEDVLRNQNFVFGGKTIPAPRFVSPGNKWVTDWELNKHIPLSETTAEQLEEFNHKFCNFEPGEVNLVDGKLVYTPFSTLIGKSPELKSNLTQADLDRVPKNFFMELGYNPLTRDQIING